MSKPRNNHQHRNPNVSAPVAAEFTAQPEPRKQRTIEPYRHCPLCWEGSGGYGDCYSTQGRTRYYKCCQTTNPDAGPCGHTWTVFVKLEVVKIEHRVVTLDGER
jgi:hypothetical protein